LRDLQKSSPLLLRLSPRCYTAPIHRLYRSFLTSKLLRSALFVFQAIIVDLSFSLPCETHRRVYCEQYVFRSHPFSPTVEESPPFDQQVIMIPPLLARTIVTRNSSSNRDLSLNFFSPRLVIIPNPGHSPSAIIHLSSFLKCLFSPYCASLILASLKVGPPCLLICCPRWMPQTAPYRSYLFLPRGF